MQMRFRNFRVGLIVSAMLLFASPALATDLMVWIIMPEGTRERMAVLREEAWSVPGPNE